MKIYKKGALINSADHQRLPSPASGMLRYNSPMMSNFWLIFIAGGVGAILRHGVASWGIAVLPVAFGVAFPWGTLLVNALGCLLAGMVFAVFEAHKISTEWIKLLFVVGLLGGFTTFSSYIADAVLLFQNQEVEKSLIYLVISPLLGGVLFLLGQAGTKFLFSLGIAAPH